MPNAGRNFDYSIRRPNVYIPSNPRRFNRRRNNLFNLQNTCRYCNHTIQNDKTILKRHQKKTYPSVQNIKYLCQQKTASTQAQEAVS